VDIKKGRNAVLCLAGGQPSDVGTVCGRQSSSELSSFGGRRFYDAVSNANSLVWNEMIEQLHAVKWREWEKG
jgi:hypothetical protein